MSKKPLISNALIIIILILLIIITAISYHSIQEIHYLKSFFPRSFTVEEAMYASIIELIKILIISIPITVAIVTSLYLFNINQRSPK